MNDKVGSTNALLANGIMDIADLSLFIDKEQPDNVVMDSMRLTVDITSKGV